MTIFLSNDATAVVLTPAVYAAIGRARVTPMLPYLFRLCLYRQRGFRAFLLPPVVSIGVTYAALWWTSRANFHGPLDDSAGTYPLTASGRRAVWGLALTAMTQVGAAGPLAAPFGVALLSNIANNLPSGLLTAGALDRICRLPVHWPPFCGCRHCGARANTSPPSPF